MIVVLAGFVAGLIHVFMGPDNLAAIAPIATKQQRGSWLAGLVWGLGHSAGVGLVGMMSLVLREFLPVESISEYSDRLVGVMLIAIGAWGLRKALQIHTHRHTHDGAEHEHIHMHAGHKVHRHSHAAF